MLIDRALFGEAGDHRIQIAMFTAQFVQAAEQRIPVSQHCCALA